MNCVERYFHSDFKHSDRPAIVFYNGLKSLNDKKRVVSFKDLTDKALRARKFLVQKGLQKGDVVLMFEAPSPNMYAMILAMLAMGIQIMLVEPWMPLKNINAIIEKTRPKGFMASFIGKAWGARSRGVRSIPIWFKSEGLESVRVKAEEMPIENMEEEDRAILTFTSGTSGAPKGVHRKHRYLIDQALTLQNHLPPLTDKLDLTVFTNVALLNLGMGKGSLLMPARWPEKAIKDLDSLPEKFRPDTLACGPGFLRKLLKNAKAPYLTHLHFGGALADIALYKEALKNWPNATLEHIYGSSEAEPVALSDLKQAVNESEKAGSFQVVYLGRPVPEIQIKQMQNSLWVSGVHVSPLYEGDDAANLKNKKTDPEGKVWHNMGDHIDIKDEALWYAGRDFQRKEDFALEQKIYHELGHSKAFISYLNGKLQLVGEVNKAQASVLSQKYALDSVKKAKIVRDPRHRARIDRKKTMKKSKTLL